MYLISETTASPPETNATFWQNTNGNLRPSAESVRPLLSSSSSKRKILIAVLVAASVFFIVLFGIGFYLYRRKMELAKEAKYGLVNSPKPNEIAVEYRAHDPSVGGSLSSCESTAPLTRQPSLRSRLASNLTQVSEEDMPLDEKWEIDRELISLQEVLGEGAFGRVMKAEVFGMPNMPFRLNVAVKMLKGKFCILAITGKDTSAFIASFLTIIVLKCSIRFLKFCSIQRACDSDRVFPSRPRERCFVLLSLSSSVFLSFSLEAMLSPSLSLSFCDFPFCCCCFGMS